MPAFTPPPSAPLVVEIAPPRYGASPLSVESHGYRYVVTGNTLLPPELIDQVLAATATPKDALGALQNTYHAHGYHLIAITGQEHGKTVAVTVFEGIVTQVSAPDGMGCFFPGLEGRNNVESNELVYDQILAGAYAARSGKKVDVNVSPAENPGGTTITITTPPLPDYQPISGILNFGNYGNRYSSGYIVGGDVQADLTHGIQITANYVRGLPGLRASSYGSTFYQGGIGISAVTPYGIYGFSATGMHFHLGRATAPLNPVGNIYTYTLNGNQLVYADTATRWSVSEALNRTSNTETVLSNYYTLLRQVYNWGTLSSTVSRAVKVAGQSGNLTASASLNLGLSGPSGTLYDNIPGVPTSHFRYIDMSGSYQQNLPRGFQLNLVALGQWAFNTLPSQQQWTLGGLGDMTAWEPGSVVGDSGYVGRLDFYAPSLNRFRTEARLGMFLETGGVTHAKPAPSAIPWQTLMDAGVSLKLNLPYKFTITAMAAVPLEHGGFNAVGEKSLKMNRINAFVVVQKRL